MTLVSRNQQRLSSNAIMARILTVDDEPCVTEGLRLILERAGYGVVRAHCGLEALELLDRYTIDAIIADQHMPRMNGTELLRLARDRFPATARLLLTGAATLECAVTAINESRVARLLQKPCPSAELLNAVAVAMNESRAAQAAEAQQSVPATPVQPPSVLHMHNADLTAREQRVLDLLLQGFRIAHIADTLHLSRHTVRNHLKAIFGKLDVHSQAELISTYRSGISAAPQSAK
jgi:DNA-binding NarL/FixJ family response regulator